MTDFKEKSDQLVEELEDYLFVRNLMEKEFQINKPRVTANVASVEISLRNGFRDVDTMNVYIKEDYYSVSLSGKKAKVLYKQGLVNSVGIKEIANKEEVIQILIAFI